MSTQESVNINKKVDFTDEGNVKIYSDAEEVFKKPMFVQMVADKKNQLFEVQNRIAKLKGKLLECQSVEITPELEAFKVNLEKVQKHLELEDVKQGLATLEMHHANIEREVLAYDNFTKGKGKSSFE